MKKLLALTYPQGSLIIEGKKWEVSLTAQIPSRSAAVTIKDWAIVDIQGTVKLAFLGLLPKNHTIQGEGGYVVTCQTDKKGELQTSTRIGKDGERKEYLSFSLLLRTIGFSICWRCALIN
jgi:hypothetical protein